MLVHAVVCQSTAVLKRCVLSSRMCIAGLAVTTQIAIRSTSSSVIWSDVRS